MRTAATTTRYNHIKEAVRNGVFKLGTESDWPQDERVANKKDQG